ncbi:tRNA pseudouridine(13) synthase TruD [Hydrogenivirga sp. 128-5-R1-1]|uniref:tRNA pseudouridine(13) synthase TruD n=1 Tax=Hydrogenivirga sp. 128-5-R1-1 TaxID=392423 RepID=UPI00015F0CF6|nr:tRNA pseudouridine(13) synthase TruD [Hydrogenivirga sp. 128-5-R1-1]EDP75994.1 tRNA pseudouridine synthase D [Hydrogenivirga sp. 128-5-R1-1]
MARVKECPEDFYVREIKHLDFEQKGRFAYFLMRKKNLSTLEAVREVAKRLGVPEKRIGFGGLKDKNSLSEQFISVDRPPEIKEFTEENLSLKFLGYGNRPVSLGDIEGNYFEITLRRIGDRKREFLKERIPFVKRFGFENYFGEQRFGSVRYAGNFIVKYLLRNDYEGAVKEYLTSLKDRGRKKALLRAWGRWKEFLRIMPQSSHPEINLVKSLMKGKSYEEALSGLPKSIKLMFLFAYQSYLWNRYLNTFVVRYFKHCSVPFLKWRLSFIKEVDEGLFEEIRELEIPFLGTEFKPKNKKVELIIKEVLREEGINEEVIRARRIGVKLFTDGVRKAFAFPQGLRVLEEGRGYVKLSFTLPPGSYATVLLRKLLCSSLDY